jgi:formylglycine-generating enzyme required for sulfatase activity
MNRLFISISGICISYLFGCNHVPQVGDEWINPKDGMSFVWIPAGSMDFQFSYDSAGEVRYNWKNVELTEGFWLGKTEVTVKQFKKFVEETNYQTEAERDNNRFTWKDTGFDQEEDHPVVYVSISDAKAYAAWVDLSLPFEDEWLYASRGGANTNFYWGDSIDEDYLWYRTNAITGTKAVGSKKANQWGLYDIIGNVWEYTKVYECDTIHSKLGASWTRCNEARGWWGPVYGNVIQGAARPRLSRCQRTIYTPYPFDDDTGFRLIRRIKPFKRAITEI